MDGRVVHIVEPTLASESGHCHSFVLSVCRAGAEEGLSFRLWCGAGARLPEIEAAGVAIRPYFYRRIRRFQAAFLYRRLLRRPETLFIPTAGRADLALICLAARATLPPGEVFLYFHWIKAVSGKASLFRRAAASQPNLTVMGPTPAVADTLRSWGFSNAVMVPYPITPRNHTAQPAPFRWFLYAGAARSDKGFGHVVDLASFLKQKGLTVPMAVQTSADHYDKYEEDVRRDLIRLRALDYPHLVDMAAALAPGDYDALYRGAVVLQPYDAADFADRVSGITLDALSLGAPVVVPAGTWMAAVVERFGAGRIASDLSPEGLFTEANRIRCDYASYSARASEAGRSLQAELSARTLASVLSGGRP